MSSPSFFAQGDDGSTMDHPRPDDPHGDSATAGVIRAEDPEAPSPPAPSRRRRYWPTLARWRKASWTALKDTGTWAPAAGAAVVGFSGWDREISNWAVNEAPIFGSPAEALEASDELRTATHLAMIGTALVTPSEDAPWHSKWGRLAIEHAGVLVDSQATQVLKRATRRERPNRADDGSFPSTHSSMAFSYATFASEDLNSIQMPQLLRMSLKVGFTTLAAGTAWARVEGGVHYPSDVLAGAALGHFVGHLVHDAFLGRKEKVSVGVQLDHEQRGLGVRILLP